MKFFTRIALGFLVLGCAASARADEPELPNIPTDAFGGALTDEQRDSGFAAIQNTLERLKTTLPTDAAQRADYVAQALRGLPEVRLVVINDSKTALSAQLRDGTPYLITNELTPPTAPSPPARGRMHRLGQPGEIATNDKVLLVDVERLGGAATAQIQQSFQKKNYTPVLSTGSLNDLRTLVKDVSVLWMSTHGVDFNMQLLPNDPTQLVQIFTIGTGEKVTPCPSPPDAACLANREDMNKMRLTRNSYIDGGPQFWLITRAFVRNYWTFAKNSLVYIDACYSGSAVKDVQGFQSDLKTISHAGAYLGWTQPAVVATTAQISSTFFDTILGANLYHPPSPPQRPFSAGTVFSWMDGANMTHDPLGTAELIYQQWVQPSIILAPTIRNLRVNEEKKTLTLIGEFGTQPGDVFVDTNKRNISSWAADQIVVDLPTSGAGSSGDVVVQVRNHPSNTVPLSLWTGTIQEKLTSAKMFGSPGPYYTASCSKLMFRADVHKYRDQPNDVAKAGEARDGTVPVTDADSDSICSYDVGGAGTKNDVKIEFVAIPPKGPIPWYPNQHTPGSTKPWWFFLGKIDTVTARAQFIFNYLTQFKAKETDLRSGFSYSFDYPPMFNTGNTTLKTWFQLNTDLTFPKVQGVPVTIPGMPDSGLLDYDLSITGAPTANTEG